MASPELSVRERMLRDRFVLEYSKDNNSFKAAQRVGFMHSFAAEYAYKFMQEPYVQQRIAEHQFQRDAESKYKNATERGVEDFFHRAMHDPSITPTQIAAGARLCALYGMDAPTKGSLELGIADAAAAIHALVREMDESVTA